ncbi:MAG: CocE/NonD family hydrolase, partial [Armatimonadetes bacterium]|nr:CocE/NonD family hydrolase [Armatimonadota bacterium]
PSLVAMCAYSIPLELTEVDWLGGFRPGRRIRWWMTTMAPDLRRREGLPKPHTPEEANQIWNDLEHGRWLGFLPWLEFPKYLPKRLAEQAEDWLRHPSRRPWRFEESHQEVEVPNLDFSGWYDHCGGTMGHLPGMQRNARTAVAREQTKLILGPWHHCGLGARKIGEVDFGPNAALDLADVHLRWFDHWLKGADNGLDREPPVRYFVMGSGKWRSAATWPPEGKRERVFYLSSDGAAQLPDGSGALCPAPSTDEPPDCYAYDPNDPVPTLWTRDLFTVPSDRRLLDHRRDILRYRTPPLVEDLEVVGYPEVVLHAASSAPDTDFFARLVDDDPEGRAPEVCYGMVRARHRNSLDREELLTPGAVTEYRIRLGATACCFRTGHRLRLETTSSDFPNHDRNHNTGKNDLADTELRVAQQQVFHTVARPSRLIVAAG